MENCQKCSKSWSDQNCELARANSNFQQFGVVKILVSQYFQNSTASATYHIVESSKLLLINILNLNDVSFGPIAHGNNLHHFGRELAK